MLPCLAPWNVLSYSGPGGRLLNDGITANRPVSTAVGRHSQTYGEEMFAENMLFTAGNMTYVVVFIRICIFPLKVTPLL